MILHLTEYKSNHKYNKNELNKFVDCLCEEIIKANDVLKRYRQYEDGDETKASLGSLFNDIADEISRKFEVKRVKFNISSKVGLSNYIEIFFSLPYGVTKKSLSHYKIRLSDHPPKKKEFNEISIPIVGSTVNKLKDDIMKVVDSRIELINDAEHKYLYGECFNMVKRYNHSKKFIKEAIDDTSYISLIDPKVMKEIKDFRTKVNEIAKLIYNNNFILSYTDNKLYDVAYNCDLGPNGEWFNDFCEDQWASFDDECDYHGIEQDWIRGSNSKFYLTNEDDYVTKYIRDNMDKSYNDDLDEIANFVALAYCATNIGYTSEELYGSIMTDSELEQYLLDSCLWYAEHMDMNNEEAIADIMERWYPDDTNELNNIKNNVTKTVEAYKLIENFKDNQVDIYNNWLENQKEEYPDIYSYEDEV